MESNGPVVGIVGSPNPDGRTNQLVSAALAGAAKAGAETDLIQLSEHVPAACEDCLPWVCKDNLRCTYEDAAFEFVSGKVLHASGLVLGTPVYWWDTSGMVKYFMLKMSRIYAMSAPLNGLPALGIGIAGGTGNGLISGLRPVYHFFQIMQMRPVAPAPATRFNFEASLKRSETLGAQIAEMSRARKRFNRREEMWLLYDALPYLGLSRAAERRLLADWVSLAVSEGGSSPALTGLAKADALAAEGRPLDALMEIAEVYEAGVERFEARARKRHRRAGPE